MGSDAVFVEVVTPMMRRFQFAVVTVLLFAAIFVVANSSAYRGYFQDDEIVAVMQAKERPGVHERPARQGMNDAVVVLRWCLEDGFKSPLDRVAEACNAEVANDRRIEVSSLPREQAFAIPDIIRTATNLVPPEVEIVRIVDIVDTHVNPSYDTLVRYLEPSARLRVDEFRPFVRTRSSDGVTSRALHVAPYPFDRFPGEAPREAMVVAGGQGALAEHLDLLVRLLEAAAAAPQGPVYRLDMLAEMRTGALLAKVGRIDVETLRLQHQLDRLSRDVHFVSGLMAEKVPFIVAELAPMPTASCCTYTLRWPRKSAQ